jgi:hypothetical protein
MATAQKIDAGNFDNGAHYDVSGFLGALRGAVATGGRVEIVGTPRIGVAGGRYNPGMIEIREAARRSGVTIAWTS